MTDVPDAFREALGENWDGIESSAHFLQLYHPGMRDDFLDDPWPAIQLGIALLMGKPIIVIVPPGRELPEKLRRIADHVIEGGGPEEWAGELARIFGAGG